MEFSAGVKDWTREGRVEEMVYRRREDVEDGRKLESGEQVREKSLMGRNGW